MNRSAVSAPEAIQEFKHRKIACNQEYTVDQGILKVWTFCNNYLAEIQTHTGWEIIGKYVYINTSSPQEIADLIMADSELTKPEMAEMEILAASASNLGRLGGMAKTEAKSKASRENGKKGGRPKKVQ